ncbi:MAG: hypothetical protein EXR90_03440, partial [Methyloglobulus sp.]|nr:hypothetical protein [Methyloglobulus sp.]
MFELPNLSITIFIVFKVTRYAVEVATGFISTLTDQVLDDMRAWQQRALSERYAVVYLDALVTSSRQNGTVAKRH